ncbi:translation initiation factor IF-2 [Yunchengibacter salinarum]|uniref:translation initiation factor IF-2 n=1 Tax=Yunchengibacter salinarum TaxID=3133399 RepID=UPI0035B66143
MSDDKKLTLSGRSKLGVNAGKESGSAGASSGGARRGKTVVVERKKKRLVKKGGSAAAPQQAAPRPQAPAFKPKKPAPPRRSSEDRGPRDTSADGLTSAELANRSRVLEEARKRQAEEAVRRAAEEEERKKREAAENAAREQAEAVAETEARSRAEEQAKKAAEEKARKKTEDETVKKIEAERAAKEQAEEEARRKADLEAQTERMRKASEARRRSAEGETPVDDTARRKKKEKKSGAVATPRAKGKTDRNGRSRLTVSKALEGADGGRQRSVAAYRRAQAKKQGRTGGGGEQQRQSREVTIPEGITVQELANRMAEKSTAVIKALMNMGVIATINQTLDQETCQLVVEEFGHKPKLVSDADVEIGLFGAEDAEEAKQPRAPVVTVMGHVDHGKTSLLDAIRTTNVVGGEAGGITQHIGAYQVADKDGDLITFLDTPGHAAFTEMRARGARVTDIVILVVAADDGVMPQTIEAINHAKAAGVPIIVAINKIDREGADPDRVRSELLQHEVVTETFSGDVQEVEVSAINGTGIEALKEAITLQSEILELKANPDRPAEGVVVEAKLEKGRGPVATVMVQRGTLNLGDIFVAGPEWGRVRALLNDRGENVETAGPSQPVEVLGLNGAPGAGDDFAVVTDEARAREITDYRQEQIRRKRQAAAAAPKTLESLFTQMKESEDKVNFDVVIKGDVQGSVEALKTALEKAGNDDIECRVIHGGVGGITESDIALAQASDALVIGFNVRPNKQAREAAEQQGVAIKYYSVIYEAIDEVKAAMAGELGPEYKEEIIGQAEIRDVFSAGKTGMAAGCYVLEGNIRRDHKARILRDDVIIYEGQIGNLRRFKDDVTTVNPGQECGMTFENFHDFKKGDVVEIYTLHEVERKL